MTKPTEEELLQDKYFYSVYPWGEPTRHPEPVDCSAHDIYECLQCGAAVLNWQKHIEWHEWLREAVQTAADSFEIVANAFEALDAET